MVKRPITSLTYKELEEICSIAEEAARRYIFSKVPKNGIADVSISVSLESSETLSVDMDVEVRLSPLYRKINVKDLVEGSVKAAFEAVEKYLKNLSS